LNPDPNKGMAGAQDSLLEQASLWIHAQLKRLGIAVTGSIDRPKMSPWSTVLRVPSTSGDIYFKAAEPALAHEPALSEALWRWHPEYMPEVLAIDPQRGWMLTPDLGTTLRSLVQSPEDLIHWERILPIYAEVQIDLANRAEELLDLGVLDRRLAELPAKYEQLLSDHEAIRLGHPEGLSDEEHRQLRQKANEFRALCQQLSGYGIPETIHHEDFHDANIFVKGGRYIFADWGESGISHPFCSLLVAWRVIAWRLELEETAPEMERLRDIYLEAWTDYESPENLIAASKLAYRVGMICRALTWNRIVVDAPEPNKAEHADAVPGWLQEFLQASDDRTG
jgi:hypothetical protein